MNLCNVSRSLPKLSSQDEEGGGGPNFGTHAHFEPIPHDHDFCERVVINVSVIDLCEFLCVSVCTYACVWVE